MMVKQRSRSGLGEKDAIGSEALEGVRLLTAALSFLVQSTSSRMVAALRRLGGLVTRIFGALLGLEGSKALSSGVDRLGIGEGDREAAIAQALGLLDGRLVNGDRDGDERLSARRGRGTSSADILPRGISGHVTKSAIIENDCRVM